MTQEELDEDGGERWYCWEEAEWEENRLFYECGLEYLEELCQRERHPMKEKINAS